MGEITYEDVEEYEKLFKVIPSFLLEGFAKKNTNLVVKFESKVKSFLNNLNDDQKHKLNIVLNSEVEELQSILDDAHSRNNLKQYEILSNPDYKEFIETNLNEVRRLMEN